MLASERSLRRRTKIAVGPGNFAAAGAQVMALFEKKEKMSLKKLVAQAVANEVELRRLPHPKRIDICGQADARRCLWRDLVELTTPNGKQGIFTSSGNMAAGPGKGTASLH